MFLKIKFQILLYSLINQVIADCFINSFITQFDTQDPTILISKELPSLNKLLPYVGNGHLASTVFDGSIYVNGLYNGKEGESHRASLPNIHNFSIQSPDTFFKDQQYALDLKNGLNLNENQIQYTIFLILFCNQRGFLWAAGRRQNNSREETLRTSILQPITDNPSGHQKKIKCPR